MSGWQRIYYRLLNLLLWVLARGKSAPAEPAQELGLDTSRPVICALPYNSKADLLTLRIQRLVHDLSDPLEPLEIDSALLPRYVSIHGGPCVFTYYTPKEEFIKLSHDYLNLHRNHPNLDVQMVPVSVTFGRSPGREKGEVNPSLRMLNGIQKFFVVSWLGRDSFVRFSPSVSLRRMADEHGTDKITVQKLVRVARMHFARQRLAAVGPRLPTRQDLFSKLPVSKAIVRVVEDEARNKKISHEKAQQNAIALMEGIAADFLYEMIRLIDRIPGFTWNRPYQGTNVYNVERVRQLAHDGYETVYVPCHRSHMDYLLLSCVSYHQGLVSPHIAADINLSFWPAGPIFRRLGVLFIRCTFKDNKLYSTVFREYLGKLLNHGYSVEHFVEGGRLHTGRLLDPKAGTLSVTIQAMLHGGTQPITLVLIYIGYEHMMEVGTYVKELRGATKEKESLLQMVRGLSKLRNLGQGHVNFGEPLPLMTYLNHHVPERREAIGPIEAIRLSWLTLTVSNIAADPMVRTNNAGAANAINLRCTALLASRQCSLTREQLTQQLECYLALLRNVPYSSDATTPPTSASELIDHVLQMNKLEVEKDTIGDIIILLREQAVLMTYYRNNIAHTLVIPPLLATLMTQYRQPSHTEVLRHIETLYLFLKAELFLRWEKAELAGVADALIAKVLCQELIVVDGEMMSLNPSHSRSLQLLAAGACEMLRRYTITFRLPSANPSISRSSLEKESRTVAQRLSVLHGINASEFFDKMVFSTLVLILRDEGYISDTGGAEPEETPKAYWMLADLIMSDVWLTIEGVVQDDA